MSAVKVLIVEDEMIIAEQVRESLEESGYHVADMVVSGEEAVKKAVLKKPDLVLMDIVLGGDMNGIEAATEIRKNLDIPVVFLTAYTDENTIQQVKVTEPYGYIIKPVKARELYTVIEMALYKHKIERELKESKQWLFTTLNSIGEGVIATDQNETIKLMNPMAEMLTGCKRDQALGKKLQKVFRIVDEQTRNAIKIPTAQVLHDGRITHLPEHVFLQTREGKEIPIGDCISPIKDDRENILGTVLVFSDISELKKMQEEIRRHNEDLEALISERTTQIQELERQRSESEKLVAAGQMAARIAHEINNPLAGIKNSFRLIRDAIPKDHPHYGYVERIEKEINRIAHIVRQMFDLYRSRETEPEQISVLETIDDVVAMLEGSLRKYGAKVEIDTGNSPLRITFQENLLRQLLFNIVENAIEASPEDGTIKITACCEEKGLVMTVSDQGKGIPEDIGPQIFKPFFTTKNYLKESGLGLGLPVCKNIVEALGGTIDFKSQVNRGTVFQIFLPLKE